jgi:DNA excision repair protein ERCC-3
VTDEEPTSDATDMGDPLDRDTFLDAVEAVGRPVVTAGEVARQTDHSQAAAADALDQLGETGAVGRVDVSADPVVYYPTEWGELADRERVVVFPERRQIVVDDASQYTRARLASFARLEATGEDDATMYEVRREDVWNAPYEDFADLREILRSVVGHPVPALESWMADQWRRAHRFRLRTHEDGYVVLEAANESLMESVATEELEDHLRARIDETEAWVAEEQVASLKRTLYEAGYPVEDDRDLETGAPLELDVYPRSGRTRTRGSNDSSTRVPASSSGRLEAERPSPRWGSWPRWVARHSCWSPRANSPPNGGPSSWRTRLSPRNRSACITVAARRSAR